MVFPFRVRQPGPAWLAGTRKRRWLKWSSNARTWLFFVACGASPVCHNWRRLKRVRRSLQAGQGLPEDVFWKTVDQRSQRRNAPKNNQPRPLARQHVQREASRHSRRPFAGRFARSFAAFKVLVHGCCGVDVNTFSSCAMKIRWKLMALLIVVLLVLSYAWYAKRGKNPLQNSLICIPYSRASIVGETRFAAATPAAESSEPSVSYAASASPTVPPGACPP